MVKCIQIDKNLVCSPKNDKKTIIANLPKGRDAKPWGLRSKDYDSPVAELF